MNETVKALMSLTKTLNVADEKFKRIEEDLRDTRKENSELRKEITDLRKEVATLAAKVAALEEGRKTVAAEVKAALTETIAAWEMQRMKEENERLRRNQLPPADGG